MSHITLVFHRFHPWLNPFHVAIVRGNEIIESNGFRDPKGVSVRNFTEYMSQRSKPEFRKIECADPDAVWEKCLSQVGKPYDWKWYLGFLSRSRKWQDDEAWVCHELILWAMGFNWKEPWIRPIHLYSITGEV